MTRPIEMWVKEDRHAAEERDHWRPATKADIVANLAAMPAEERAEVLRASGAAAEARMRTEKAERERDDMRTSRDDAILGRVLDRIRAEKAERERDEARNRAETIERQRDGLISDTRVRLGAVPAEDVFAAARRVVAERDDLRARLTATEKARDEAVKRPPTGAEIIAALYAMPAVDRQQVLKVYESRELGAAVEKAAELERERNKWRKATNELGDHRDKLVAERNEALARAARSDGLLNAAAVSEREYRARLTDATARAEKAERVAEERENIIKAQATEIDRARDRWDEAIKRTDVAETRLSRLRERGVQITGRVCSPISDDAIYYAEMLGLVVEDRDVLRTKLAAVEKERDSYRDALNAMTRGATQGAELIHRLEKERDDLRTKLREVELERDDRREVFALVRDQRDARTALSYKLEAALGQAEKELHECRVALKDALGGLDSVKDQNADLRRQLRRLQTGTEIESDRLTDVELNLQATVDRVRAERDEAINALRAAEAKMEPGRGAGGGR